MLAALATSSGVELTKRFLCWDDDKGFSTECIQLHHLTGKCGVADTMLVWCEDGCCLLRELRLLTLVGVGVNRITVVPAPCLRMGPAPVAQC